MRSRNYEQGMYSFFEPQLNVRSKEVWNGGSFLIRLQPDVSEQRFLHDFRTWAYSRSLLTKNNWITWNMAPVLPINTG